MSINICITHDQIDYGFGKGWEKANEPVEEIAFKAKVITLLAACDRCRIITERRRRFLQMEQPEHYLLGLA